MTQPSPPSQPADGNVHVDIRTLTPRELHAAADLLTEGMRDNPVHVKAFGTHAKHGRKRLRRFLGQLVAHVDAGGTLLGAFAHNELVGVLGMMKPGRCRPGRIAALRFAAAIVTSNPPRGVWRIARWLAVWARNDPAQPHWHIGPLAVRAAHRRRGIARRLMTQCCQQIDAGTASAWLETDLAINAAFYETLGFVVVAKRPVIGVPNWFMRRGVTTAGQRLSLSEDANLKH